jgi:hypothetical protein
MPEHSTIGGTPVSVWHIVIGGAFSLFTSLMTLVINAIFSTQREKRKAEVALQKSMPEHEREFIKLVQEDNGRLRDELEDVKDERDIWRGRVASMQTALIFSRYKQGQEVEPTNLDDDPAMQLDDNTRMMLRQARKRKEQRRKRETPPASKGEASDDEEKDEHGER